MVCRILDEPDRVDVVALDAECVEVEHAEQELRARLASANLDTLKTG